MKNHYVSQFIIKRFSNAINIFNVNNGKIDEDKRPSKVFYKDDIYDEEIERLCNFNIESRVANILNNKILIDGDVILTREDLNILKKYMLICSVRTLDEDSFANRLYKFESNSNCYVDIFNEYNRLPKTKEIKITNHDLYFRALKVYAASSDIRSIAINPLTTREILCWALPFLESYIAFWDTPEDKEFILTDCGMSSEYEGFHMLTGGLDLSKFSYLMHQLQNGKSQYVSMLASNFLMYENYNVFNLSSHRCMVAISPFFKLYNPSKLNVVNDGNLSERITLKMPDIWPAIIQDKNLFDIPTTEYSNSFMPFSPYAMDDKFVYKPKILNNEDLVYLNALMLSQTKEMIGFNDPTKIIDSIYYYIWFNANFNSVRNIHESPEIIASRLVDNVMKSPFKDLCNYCDSKGGINKTEFILLFEKLVNNILKDFNENPYIYEYLLQNRQSTINCKNLDFLGNENDRIKFIEEKLRSIREKIK